MKRAALLLLLIATPAWAKTVSYAIAVGVNTPPLGHDLPTLRFADDDAVRMHRFFSRFATSYLISVLDHETQRRFPEAASVSRAPSLAELRRVVADIALRMQADERAGDTPVFYFSYSGHGTADDQGRYVLAFGADVIDRHVLYDDIVAHIPARYHHLIIDACHAEAIAGSRGMFDRAQAGALSAVTRDEQRALEGEAQHFASVGTLLAASKDEQAHEWSRIQSGLFTHELLSALSGAADANRDGYVDYAEVNAFMAAANRMVKDARATPSIRIKAPSLNHAVSLVETAALRGTGFLFGAAGALGHFYIEAANGERVLDAHFDDASEVEIALPSGVPLFLHTKTQEAPLSLLDGQHQNLAALPLFTPQTAARGAVDEAYQRGLFAVAYGYAYFAGFSDNDHFEVSAQSNPESLGARRVAAIVAWSVAGVSAGAAIVSGAVAIDAKSQYDHTTVQRTAAAAANRFTPTLATAVATGATAVVTAVLGAVLWPTHAATVAIAPNLGGANLSIAGSF